MVGSLQLNRKIMGMDDAYIVEEDDGVLPPVRSLGIELSHQTLEEKLHGLGVIVGLQQAQIYGTCRLDPHDHGDPG